MPDNSSVQRALHSLRNSAETIWTRYAEVGPGRVDAELYDGVERAVRQLNAQGGDRRIDDRQIETLRDLCHRCCRRSEGLCFITGEAGLIPRRDLHEAFESALAELRHVCSDE